ncbi:MAG TPA: SGNH/GDSL hydrolase family protein [Verrucomicrobiae bacterium]|nr:SGNH/GDSL hydrolase family protein [Verrucomicrobiae bacterium]
MKPRWGLLVLLLMAPITAWASFGKLGAMGDSFTDEYWDGSGGRGYATNWTPLVVLFRGIDLGPTAVQAGTNSWGEPRRQGYEYNWARSGASSADLLAEGQHTGLLSQVGSAGVSNAVLEIGINDFNPSRTDTYSNIYNGLWSVGQIQSYNGQVLTNIETALSTVRTAGVAMVVATVLDPGASPSIATNPFFSDPIKRDRVAAAIQDLNLGMRTLAQKYQVPLMDWFALEKTILGPNTNLNSTLKVGNVTIFLRAIDPGPPNLEPTNAFVLDGFHPNTTLQGIFANLILQGFDSGYQATLSLFSEQEILNHALIPYGGSDTLLSQIGPYTNYIILPIRPRFTMITATQTNVMLGFSSASNQLYELRSRADLTTGSWSIMASNLVGTGGIVVVTNAPAGSQQFYQLRQLP